MSYDLAVFSLDAAPRDREAFLAWYAEKTRWADDVDYSDSGLLVPELEAFFNHMRGRFPPKDGPFAFGLDLEGPEFDPAYMTEYRGEESFLVLRLNPDIAEVAHQTVRELAVNEGLGFFDASAADGELLFPVPEPARQPGLFKKLFGKKP